MWRRSLLVVTPCLAVFIVVACGSSDDGGGPAGQADGGLADGVAPVIVYDGAMSMLDALCNELPTLPAATDQVSTTVVDDTAPAAVGGTLVDGTYTLTALDWYMGNALDQLPPTTSTTLVISNGGTVWQTAGTDGYADAGTGAFTINYAAIVDGDQLTLNETCPGADTELEETFTATATTLSVFDTYEGETYVRVYTME